MLAQTPAQNKVSSETIEMWMKSPDLNPTIRHYIRKFGATLERKLGLSREDLENEIRLEVWKGLLSYNKSMAKLKTYLNRLIHNRFLTLYARSELGKNNLVEYYADVFATEHVQEHDRVTYDTAESFIMQREATMQGLLGLKTQLEFDIVRDVTAGETLASMEQKHKVPRSVLIATINHIDRLMKEESA